MADLSHNGTGSDYFDVIVVGGGYAGVSAALQLAGTGRLTAVVDSGVARDAGLEDADQGRPGGTAWLRLRRRR